VNVYLRGRGLTVLRLLVKNKQNFDWLGARVCDKPLSVNKYAYARHDREITRSQGNWLRFG